MIELEVSYEGVTDGLKTLASGNISFVPQFLRGNVFLRRIL